MLKYFHCFNDLFVFLPQPEFKVARDVRFLIALTSPDTALYLYRLIQRESFLLSSLATHLAEKGIRFYTLLELEKTPLLMPLSGIQVTIPQRLPDYVFTLSDYEVYVQQRTQLLCSPWGRAALLYGGIILRIAKEHLSPEPAGMGPSSAVTDFCLGFGTEDHINGCLYWDDQLSEDELDIICGTHHLHTGRHNQIAKVSWWPCAGVWDAGTTGYNWHHWMEWDEVWYQEHLACIQRGDKKEGVPLSQNKWWVKIRGPGPWRRMVRSLSTEAGKLF